MRGKVVQKSNLKLINAHGVFSQLVELKKRRINTCSRAETLNLVTLLLIFDTGAFSRR